MQTGKALYILKTLSKSLDLDGNSDAVEALGVAIKALGDSVASGKAIASSRHKPVMSYSGKGDIPGGVLGLCLRK